MAEKWEYFTTFIGANAEKVLQEVKKTRKNAGKYAPEAMAPSLNSFGEQGWELVHMQPVFIGNNDDVKITDTGPLWTAWYFCVFKRRKA